MDSKSIITHTLSFTASSTCCPKANPRTLVRTRSCRLVLLKACSNPLGRSEADLQHALTRGPRGVQQRQSILNTGVKEVPGGCWGPANVRLAPTSNGAPIPCQRSTAVPPSCASPPVSRGSVAHGSDTIWGIWPYGQRNLVSLLKGTKLRLVGTQVHTASDSLPIHLFSDI